MKRLLSLTVAVMLLLTSYCFAASRFSDVNGTKYENAVSVLNSSGIIDGYSDGTFKPQNSVTRAELCKLLVAALKISTKSGSQVKFSDVNSSMWFYEYVKAAVDNGIIIGYNDGTFKPNNDVTYAEMFTMVIRAMKKEDQVANKSDWPNAYINYASGFGLLSNVSYTNVNFPATRGEVSVALYNMVNRLDSIPSQSTTTQTSTQTTTKTTREYGFVTSVTTKNVKIDGNTYAISSKSSTFTEDTFAVYDNTDDEVKLVAAYGVTDLDANANVVTYATGLAGEQDIKVDGSSKYADFSPKTYKSYVICLITVEENAKKKVEVVRHALKDSLNDIKLAKGDRIVKDTKNQVLVIFRGLDPGYTYKKGQRVVESSSTSQVTTKKYTVSYDWAPGARVWGVSLPASKTVEKGTKYTVKVPDDTDEYWFYAVNYSGTITVNSNITIYIDSIPIEEEEGGYAGSNMPLIDRVDEEELKREVQSNWMEYIADVYEDDVFDVRIKKVKLSADTDMDSVKFEISYELKPATEDANLLLLLTVPDGRYDDETGWVVEKNSVGIMRSYADIYYIDYSSVGTGW